VRNGRVAAVRLALAGIVVLGGVLAAVRIADYTQRGGLINPCAASLGCYTAEPGRGLEVVQNAPVIPLSWYPHDAFYWVTPWWAYALAVVVGLVGIALAVLIFRAPSRGVHRGILVPRLR
jgi:hypothetical protein